VICSSGIGFDPHVQTPDGERTRLTFGFEGIWQGTAVLYDHQTRSVWMHFTGECIDGPLKGTFLKPISSGRHTRWADWLATHPETDVLAEDAALVSPGRRHAYFPRARSRSGDPFLPPTFAPTIQDIDTRLPLSELVYGLLLDGQARAYGFTLLEERLVVEEELAQVPVSVWFDVAARSATAFRREVDGRRLSFKALGGGRFEDSETKSRWNMEGQCLTGPLKGKSLKRLRGLMAEWYGWFANYPTTTVLE
jgi:hypothetical protein